MIIQKMSFDIKNLTKSFSCGNLVLDNFIKSNNALDENQGITYLLLSDDKNSLIGYYNISVGRVDNIQKINGVEYYEPMGGAANINYLAIRREYQGQSQAPPGEPKIYLGDLLLNDCEKRILKIRKSIGISFITLHSTEEGHKLYERNDYYPFEDDMSTFISERDLNCYKMYKCIDDLL